MTTAHRFKAEIKRHHPKMPRFILVPPTVAKAFGQSATFIVSAKFGGLAAERKSIKPWGDGRWFMDVPAKICEKLGLDTGKTIAVEVEPAGEAMPVGLGDALRSAGVLRAWFALTPAQQRMTAEHVFAAKRSETMRKRVAGVIAQLKASAATNR